MGGGASKKAAENEEHTDEAHSSGPRSALKHHDPGLGNLLVKHLSVEEALEALGNSATGKLGIDVITWAELEIDSFVLEQFEELRLDHRQLGRMPNNLARFSELRVLDLSHNVLGMVPDEVLSMYMLEELRVDACGLHMLPFAIGNLRVLTSLSARDNQIEQLPVSMADCQMLEHLDLVGNPLVHPGPAIMKKGARAVVHFLQDEARIHLGQTAMQHQMKLVLVGARKSGRSTLHRALSNAAGVGGFGAGAAAAAAHRPASAASAASRTPAGSAQGGDYKARLARHVEGLDGVEREQAESDFAAQQNLISRARASAAHAEEEKQLAISAAEDNEGGGGGVGGAMDVRIWSHAQDQDMERWEFVTWDLDFGVYKPILAQPSTIYLLTWKVLVPLEQMVGYDMTDECPRTGDPLGRGRCYRVVGAEGKEEIVSEEGLDFQQELVEPMEDLQEAVPGAAVLLVATHCDAVQPEVVEAQAGLAQRTVLKILHHQSRRAAEDLLALEKETKQYMKNALPPKVAHIERFQEWWRPTEPLWHTPVEEYIARRKAEEEAAALLDAGGGGEDADVLGDAKTVEEAMQSLARQRAAEEEQRARERAAEEKKAREARRNRPRDWKYLGLVEDGKEGFVLLPAHEVEPEAARGERPTKHAARLEKNVGGGAGAAAGPLVLVKEDAPLLPPTPPPSNPPPGVAGGSRTKGGSVPASRTSIPGSMTSAVGSDYSTFEGRDQGGSSVAPAGGARPDTAELMDELEYDVGEGDDDTLLYTVRLFTGSSPPHTLAERVSLHVELPADQGWWVPELGAPFVDGPAGCLRFGPLPAGARCDGARRVVVHVRSAPPGERWILRKATIDRVGSDPSAAPLLEFPHTDWVSGSEPVELVLEGEERSGPGSAIARHMKRLQAAAEQDDEPQLHTIRVLTGSARPADISARLQVHVEVPAGGGGEWWAPDMGEAVLGEENWIHFGPLHCRLGALDQAPRVVVQPLEPREDDKWILKRVEVTHTFTGKAAAFDHGGWVTDTPVEVARAGAPGAPPGSSGGGAATPDPGAAQLVRRLSQAPSVARRSGVDMEAELASLQTEASEARLAAAAGEGAGGVGTEGEGGGEGAGGARGESAAGGGGSRSKSRTPTPTGAGTSSGAGGGGAAAGGGLQGLDEDEDEAEEEEDDLLAEMMKASSGGPLDTSGADELVSAIEEVLDWAAAQTHDGRLPATLEDLADRHLRLKELQVAKTLNVAYEGFSIRAIPTMGWGVEKLRDVLAQLAGVVHQGYLARYGYKRVGLVSTPVTSRFMARPEDEQHLARRGAAAVMTPERVFEAGTLRAHGDSVRAACVCDGWPVTVGMDGAVRVWKMGVPGRGTRGWREHKKLEHTAKMGVVCATYVRSHDIEAAEIAVRRRVGDGRGMTGARGWAALRARRGELQAAAPSLLVTVSYDGEMRAWNPEADFAPAAHVRHSTIICMCSHQGMLVTGGEDGSISLWDPAWLQSPTRTYIEHDGAVWALVSVAGKWLVSAGSDNTVRVWGNMPGGALEPEAVIDEEDGLDAGTVTAMTYQVRGDAVWLLTGDQRCITSWSPGFPRWKRESCQLRAHERAITGLEVCNSVLASGSLDRTVKLWRTSPSHDDVYGLELIRVVNVDRPVAGLGGSHGLLLAAAGRDVVAWQATGLDKGHGVVDELRRWDALDTDPSAGVPRRAATRIGMRQEPELQTPRVYADPADEYAHKVDAMGGGGAAGRRASAVKAALFGPDAGKGLQTYAPVLRPGMPGYRPVTGEGAGGGAAAPQALAYRTKSAADAEPQPERPPSAPVSARARAKPPAVVEAEKAAVRIQAGFRGMQGRRHVQQRRRALRESQSLASRKSHSQKVVTGSLYLEMSLDSPADESELEAGWERRKAAAGEGPRATQSKSKLRRNNSSNSYEVQAGVDSLLHEKARPSGPIAARKPLLP